jgi:hypothetical protein
MKIKLLGLLLILIMALPVMAAPPQGRTDNLPAAAKMARTDNTTFINANRILMFVTNHANWGRDLGGYFGNDYGTYFPYSDTALISSGADVRSPYYAGGLWMGCVDSATGETRTVISEYSDEFWPGPMSGGTYQDDIPEFRVYKLYRDSLWNNPNADYEDYMAYAVPDQGAPMPYIIDTLVDSTDDGEGGYIVTTTIDTSAAILGDQMCWSVCNDANASVHTQDAGSTNPLGIEVKNTTFSYRRENPLGDIVFIRLQIYNKGNNVLTNCFFSLWSDPDLGGSGDDLVGCDTLLDLGFVYNATNTDKYYGSKPPSLGMDFFQGPLIYTGDMADTAKMWDTTFAGYQNMGLYSFNKYINGTDPDNYGDAYNYMRGLNKDGSPYIYNGDTLTFVCTGDPVANTGDLDIAPDDRRCMQTTGPITFRPGDSTEIYTAIIVGQGGDRLSSISVMKYNDRFAQKAYDDDFIVPNPPAPPVVKVAQLDENIVLNWSDTSEIDPGDYPFQGYTVYQYDASSESWTRIANYDVNDGIGLILEETPNPITGALETIGSKFGSDNGVNHKIVIDHDYILGGALNNQTTYIFKVDAYSYDPISLPKTLTSSSGSIRVIPQGPPAGVHPVVHLQDTISVTHLAGTSDGVILPIVTNPLALTGHQYRVTFKDTVIESEDALIWFLEDVNTGDTILASMANFTGDEDYFVTDGFMLKVSGPSTGFNSFLCVANADGVLDPPEAGAFGAVGFPVNPLEEGANPTTRQQVGGARWAIHTADNGGTCGGGTRWTFDAFFDRITRSGDNFASIGGYDYEMRFTGSYDDPGVNGSYVADFDDAAIADWVPFEIWQTGLGTPDDASDDVKLVCRMIDEDASGTFNLESWGCINDTNPVRFGGDGEHSVSGGDNDPFTDWTYWYLPTDITPGTAGYDANEAQMLAGTFDLSLLESEIFARFVLVNWNGHLAAETGDTLTNPPVFNMDMPEVGTIFRITTFKPITSADTFLFTADAPTMTSNEVDLDKINTVPNPFYLLGGYDPNPGSYQIRFQHLPAKCKITIYNLAGDLIRTINKDDATADWATWDVLTERGLPVSSGIYIYVVEAPGFGKKIGKMAVFVQAEVLKYY